MSLDTLDNVKIRLGVSTTVDDALFDLLRASADLWIGNYCDRNFGGGTYTEYHPGGSEFVHLKNYPVESVTSVNVDPGHVFSATTILSNTAYVVHSERGVIQSLVGPLAPHLDRQGLVNRHVYHWTKGPRVIQIVYTVAADPVPDDIREAYAQLIGHWYRRIKTQAGLNFINLSGQKIGEVSATYHVAQIAGLPMPPDIASLLAPYRVPSV